MTVILAISMVANCVASQVPQDVHDAKPSDTGQSHKLSSFFPLNTMSFYTIFVRLDASCIYWVLLFQLSEVLDHGLEMA